MTFGDALLAAFAALVAFAFARMAWTGRIDFGKGNLTERARTPVAFWAVWAIGVGLFSLAFTCWFGHCYR